jgi:RNA recognition motif-containing protein
MFSQGGIEDDFGDKKAREDLEPGRALYIGQINASASPHIYSDLCAIANEFGALEMVKVVPQKGCAFVNFIEEGPARAFYQAAEEKPIQLGDTTLKIRWAKATPIKDELYEKIKAGATRNLFIGNLPEAANEDTLAHYFQRYGPIESIVILRPKAIAFVNLTSVRSAISARQALDNQDLAGRRIKVNFAKEKVGVKRPTTQPRQSRAPEPHWGAPPPPPNFYGSPYPPPPPSQLYPPALPTPPASRAIFLGNVQDDVTLQEICKLANRYGAIESVKIVKAKSSAFVNFIDPNAAAAFVSAAQQNPITLANQPIRVNWVKSTPIHPEILGHVRQGATRNLFVGNVEDHISDDLIRELFSPFGEFDSIVVLRPKKIAFVNFASLKSALKAREALQGQSVGDPPVQLKINYAKEIIPGSRPRQSRQQYQQTPGSP